MVKETIKIRNTELANRIVMPPIATYLCTEDGKVTEKLLAYYNERAKDGRLSMIITEHSYISMQGKAKENQLSIASDEDIEGLSRLVKVIRQSGTKTIAQLNHAGAATSSSLTGEKKVSASPVVLPVTPVMGDGEAPEALTKEQIPGIVKTYVAAAKRAAAAGYDGVEIHSAHAYLLNEFYSPLTNHRTDEYGGCLENRIRFHKEVLSAVREAIGPELILAVRLGGCDYREGGSTIEDSVAAAKVFEEIGVDLIDISGGMCRYNREGHTEPGYFQDMSSAIKKAVTIPVMLTGGIRTVSEAEELLSNGAADLIGIGRSLLKNPRWAEENGL